MWCGRILEKKGTAETAAMTREIRKTESTKSEEDGDMDRYIDREWKIQKNRKARKKPGCVADFQDPLASSMLSKLKKQRPVTDIHSIFNTPSAKLKIFTTFINLSWIWR